MTTVADVRRRLTELVPDHGLDDTEIEFAMTVTKSAEEAIILICRVNQFDLPNGDEIVALPVDPSLRLEYVRQELIKRGITPDTLTTEDNINFDFTFTRDGELMGGRVNLNRL